MKFGIYYSYWEQECRLYPTTSATGIAASFRDSVVGPSGWKHSSTISSLKPLGDVHGGDRGSPSGEATREAQKAGIVHARPPSRTAIGAGSRASIGRNSTSSVKCSRKDDPAKAEAMLAEWGL